MRTNYEIRKTGRFALRGNLDVVLGILILISVIEFVASLVLIAVPFLLLIPALILTPAFTLSQSKMFIMMVRGDRPTGRSAFYGFYDFWAAFKVLFLMALYVFLWSLLFIVPGIIKAFSYSQALNILADNPGMPANEAIARSEAMMRGHKTQYLSLILSFIGWIILGIFTFGILYLWLIPYMLTSSATFYCELLYHYTGNNAPPYANPTSPFAENIEEFEDLPNE